MELREAIIKRRSVRKFVTHKEVDDLTIKSIIDLGLKAPSAGNLQPTTIFVIRNPKKKRKLATIAFDQSFISAADVVLLVCVDKLKVTQRYGERGRTLYCIQDAAAVIQNILLAVTAKNLGACWVGAFDEEQCMRFMTLDESTFPVAIIPIGYESGMSPTRKKRTVEDVIIWE